MLRQSRTVLGINLVVVLCVLAANIGGEQLSCCIFLPAQGRTPACAHIFVAHLMVVTIHHLSA